MSHSITPSTPATPPLLSVNGLVKEYPGRRRSDPPVRAVDDVSFEIHSGQTLALVGESGCGKSSVGKCVARLAPISRGRVQLDGIDLATLPPRRLRAHRQDVQYIFQDPYAALNPTMTIGQVLAEPLLASGRGRPSKARDRAADLLDRVGLQVRHLDRHPHQFSGGQRQRIVIARALMLQPRLLILDEPVSALDVSIQAQILNLLAELQEEFELAYLFISHDLSVVSHVADRIAVMYLGTIVEEGSREQLTTEPKHPYSRSLLSAVPQEPDEPRRERIVLTGDLPSPAATPTGCRFHTRCFKAADECSTVTPELLLRHDRLVACHRIDTPDDGTSLGPTARRPQPEPSDSSSIKRVSHRP